MREDGIECVDADLSLAVCLPDIVVSTRDARGVVPQSASMDDLVATVGSAATLTLGMCQNDPVQVGRGVEEHLVTPARAALVDGYDAACEAAREAGATGVTVSGSGPGVLAVCRREDRKRVAGALVDAFEGAGVDASAYPTEVGDGATFV